MYTAVAAWISLTFCMFFCWIFQPVPISPAEVWSRALSNGFALSKCYSRCLAPWLFRYTNYVNFGKADFSGSRRKFWSQTCQHIEVSHVIHSGFLPLNIFILFLISIFLIFYRESWLVTDMLMVLGLSRVVQGFLLPSARYFTATCPVYQTIFFSTLSRC